jgi:hypothetical protein
MRHGYPSVGFIERDGNAMLWMSVRFGWGNTVAMMAVAVLPFLAASEATVGGSAQEQDRLEVRAAADPMISGTRATSILPD